MKIERSLIEDSLTKLEEYRRSTIKLLTVKRKSLHKIIKDQFEELRRHLYSREFEVINEIDAIFEEQERRLDLALSEKSDTATRLRKKANDRIDVLNSESFFEVLAENITNDVKEVNSKLSKAHLGKIQKMLLNARKFMAQQSEMHRELIQNMRFIPESFQEEVASTIPLDDFWDNSQDISRKFSKSLVNNSRLTTYSANLELFWLSSPKLKVSLSSKGNKNNLIFDSKEWPSISSVEFIVENPSLKHKEQLLLNYTWHHLQKIRDINISFNSKGITDSEVLNYLRSILQKTSDVESLNISFDGCEGADLCMRFFFKKILSRMQK